ncbi:hypothetical protein CgunFtcFv8_013558 [Champsocephalus gunnari]|uniref:Uncharacterized protein n=1 Tax=Champsocephalus gunnari TaxID=52237 RepID=A0AAN8DST9_CHAGU|nr:hypothetical protein CgunFtcFv8_013558 [Champsocephalus gunnari]
MTAYRNQPLCTYVDEVVCARMLERLCVCWVEVEWTEPSFVSVGLRALRLRDEERAQSTADSFRSQTDEINQTQSKEREKQANGKIRPKSSKT